MNERPEDLGDRVAGANVLPTTLLDVVHFKADFVVSFGHRANGMLNGAN